MNQLLKEGAIRPPGATDPAARARGRRSSPWGPLLDRATAGSHATRAPAPIPAPLGQAAGDPAPLPPEPAPGTIERRLGRRAEALWARLPAGPSGLPDSAAAGPLLAPPFASHALLVGLAPPGGSEGDPGARILHVGSALAALAVAAPGREAGFGDAPLIARLVALASAAAAGGRPMHLDSEEADTGPAASGGLVWRAVALPFAGTDTAGPTALVIASWRRRLSDAETAALHRELAAAIDWMHKQRPTSPNR